MVFLLLAGCASTGVQQDHARLLALSSEETTGPAEMSAARFATEFDRGFGVYVDTARLARLPDGDLDRVFEAASLAASTGHGQALAVMRGCVDLLEARGRASDAQREQLHAMLVLHRAFAAAESLRREHSSPSMEAIPPIVVLAGARGNAPTVLMPDARDFVLWRRPVRLGLPIEVVAIWQPGCRFAQRALADIRANPRLAQALLGRAHWVAPASGRLDFDRIQTWNAANPDVAVALLYREAEWPAGMTLDATPAFHVFIDGVLAGKVEGWQGPASEAALVSLLARWGALPAQAGD